MEAMPVFRQTSHGRAWKIFMWADAGLKSGPARKTQDQKSLVTYGWYSLGFVHTARVQNVTNHRREIIFWRTEAFHHGHASGHICCFFLFFHLFIYSLFIYLFVETVFICVALAVLEVCVHGKGICSLDVVPCFPTPTIINLAPTPFRLPSSRWELAISLSLFFQKSEIQGK